MTYQQALDYISAIGSHGNRPGLERIRTLMEGLDNVQNDLRFVHLAGTNGKGSTSCMLASILQRAGYKTGLFVSPFIIRFNERMQVNGRHIPDEKLAEIVERIKPLADALEGGCTEFELITAAAFVWFAEEQCDIVVLETGLGGRLDATNIIPPPEAAVIMNIGLDHTGILGDTPGKIAAEKAGIVKEGCAVVTYPGEPEVEAVYDRVCREKHALWRKTDLSRMTFVSEDLFGQTFLWDGEEYTVRLLGEHQRSNAAVALETLEVLREKGWNIPDEAIRVGLESARWPARLEVLGREPLFILDGAHNGQCAKALADSLNSLLPGKKLVFLTGVLADKDYHDIMALMLPMAKEFFCLTPFSERALPAAELTARITEWGGKATCCETVEEGIEKALASAGKDGAVVSFGSLYLAGAVREAYLK